jgi:hypothetical protein
MIIKKCFFIKYIDKYSAYIRTYKEISVALVISLIYENFQYIKTEIKAKE